MFFIQSDGRIAPAGRLDADIARFERLLADFKAARDGHRLDRADLADAPLIDDWRIALRQTPCLVGHVTGHPDPNIGRGALSVSVTSDLWMLDEARRVARTLSRWYRLGVPHGGGMLP